MHIEICKITVRIDGNMTIYVLVSGHISLGKTMCNCYTDRIPALLFNRVVRMQITLFVYAYKLNYYDFT